jgi:hypothetical protein
MLMDLSSDNKRFFDHARAAAIIGRQRVAAQVEKNHHRRALIGFGTEILGARDVVSLEAIQD